MSPHGTMRPRWPVNSATNATTSGTSVMPTRATSRTDVADVIGASTGGAGRECAAAPCRPSGERTPGDRRSLGTAGPRDQRSPGPDGVASGRWQGHAAAHAVGIASRPPCSSHCSPPRCRSRPRPPVRRGRRRGTERIAPIAHEVEHLRHLRFLHPIPARFLSDRAFRKEVTSDDHPKAKDRRRDLVSEAELRALGLVDGSFDLRKTVDDVQGSDVLAFYDSDRKRIVVRGTHLDAEHRVTLAHELTHGLQDQHYDLTKLQDAVHTGGADDALTALIEGDATRIEDEYYGHARSRRISARSTAAEGATRRDVADRAARRTPTPAASSGELVRRARSSTRRTPSDPAWCT